MGKAVRFARWAWTARGDVHLFLTTVPALIAAVVTAGIVGIMIAAIDQVPRFLWIPLGLFIILLLELIIYGCLQTIKLIYSFADAPLEIIFDPRNPFDHFWSHGSNAEDTDIPVILPILRVEYRIKVLRARLERS